MCNYQQLFHRGEWFLQAQHLIEKEILQVLSPRIGISVIFNNMMRRGPDYVVDAHLCRGLRPYADLFHQVISLSLIGYNLEMPAVWLVREGSKKREVEGEAMLGMERSRKSLQLCEGHWEIT